MCGNGSFGSKKLMNNDFYLSAILWKIDIESDYLRGDSFRSEP